MNHEEKPNTYRSAGAAKCFSTDSTNSEHSKMQYSYYNLRDRVRDMLSNGIKIPAILKEISDDELCDKDLKKKILSEIHSLERTLKT